MNRMEEYQALMEELAQMPPALEGALERARRRQRKRAVQRVLRPLSGLAACFALFVLLVNFSAPVAHACSRVPILRDLAQAVTFSRSLSDAVDNDFVQTMGITQSQNGITAEVAYLIVDQKQVNVFYRLDSQEYTQLAADPDVRRAQGLQCSISSGSFHSENGKLRQVTIDFLDQNVPDSLVLALRVYSNAWENEERVPADRVADIFEEDPQQEDRGYVAQFEFLLEFDPQFTAAGRVFPVDQKVLLEGQAITVTQVEVYPTHIRVDIAEDPENTAWLKDLDFYIETDWGMKFEPVSSGITATGAAGSPSMVSYRADSSYFYDARHLKLVITGAKWLRKDMETTWLNLLTGQSGPLPQGAAFDSARRTETGWVLRFRAAWQEGTPMYQLFRQKFRDAQGQEYEINMWSSTKPDPDEQGNVSFFYDEFPLKNYPYEEVWLYPAFSHHWEAENEIVITVQ